MHVSEGSACNSGSFEPSHVMLALGIDEGFSFKDYARSCIRISLSASNTKQEIDFLIQSLKELPFLTHQPIKSPLIQTLS